MLFVFAIMKSVFSLLFAFNRNNFHNVCSIASEWFSHCMVFQLASLYTRDIIFNAKQFLASFKVAREMGFILNVRPEMMIKKRSAIEQFSFHSISICYNMVLCIGKAFICSIGVRIHILLISLMPTGNK